MAPAALAAGGGDTAELRPALIPTTARPTPSTRLTLWRRVSAAGSVRARSGGTGPWKGLPEANTHLPSLHLRTSRQGKGRQGKAGRWQVELCAIGLRQGKPHVAKPGCRMRLQMSMRQRRDQRLQKQQEQLVGAECYISQRHKQQQQEQLVGDPASLGLSPPPLFFPTCMPAPP